MYNKDELLKQLDDWDIKVANLEHEAVFTVEESHSIHSQIPGIHSKNLFLKDKKGRLFLITACHDTEIDLKKIHRVIGASGRLSFADADKLMIYLGVEPGSVTPFAVINDTDHHVTMVLDCKLMDHDFGNYHPLTNTATTTIKNSDLVRYLKLTGHAPLILNISSDSAD